MVYLEFKNFEDVPHCFNYRFVVNAKDEKELEEKLSKKYESPVSVLIIDCIDMRNRTHNAEISGKYFRATVNIFWVDELEAIE